MAKKKKTKPRAHRVGNRKSPAKASVAVAQSETTIPKVAAELSPEASPVAAAGRWDYVTTDIRRVAVLLILCVVIEIVLSYLLNHTSLGPRLYSHTML